MTGVALVLSNVRYIVDAPVDGGRKVEFPGLGRVGGLADLKEALGKYLRESTKPPVVPDVSVRV